MILLIIVGLYSQIIIISINLFLDLLYLLNINLIH